MNAKLGNAASVAQIVGTVGFIMAAVINNWQSIQATGGEWASKIMLAFLCLLVIGSGMSYYYTRFHGRPESPSTGTSTDQAPASRTKSKRSMLVAMITGAVILCGVLVWVIYRGFQSPARTTAVTAQPSPSPAVRPSPSPFDKYSLIQIRGRKFANQRVELDGHYYYDCEFTNPTFVFNGGPVAFENSKIKGSMIFVSENEAVLAAWSIAKGFFPSQGILIDENFNPATNVQSITIEGQPTPERHPK